ncbi:hypothetical protein SAMN04488529_10590 [Clostridium gasigenes]|uniref:Uncharacterized protein n=1 Tax=Clostridium gasigenes TaxID=94869 RepID=A0A1H0SK95_9CLOT|nr:hypothetical protein SAMN04488529_10590 [Clostridium gasigenes]
MLIYGKEGIPLSHFFYIKHIQEITRQYASLFCVTRSIMRTHIVIITRGFYLRMDIKYISAVDLLFFLICKWNIMKNMKNFNNYYVEYEEKVHIL